MGKRKKRPVGVCRLCGTRGPLELSHLIPRGVYEIIMSADPKQKAPIMMTDKIKIMKHQQIKDYLLCASCENLINKSGEEYAQTLMSKPTGFKLLDRLNVAPTMSFRIDGKAYPGAEIGLDMDRLAYFALSVFWRAGAHQWPSKMTVKNHYSIDLGDYLDPIGEFLRRGAYPQGVALMMTAATDFLSQGYAFMPAPTTDLPVTAYGFLTCGIHFGLYLHKPMVPFFRRFCCVTAPRRPIFARNLHAQTMHAAGRLYRLGRSAKNMQGS